MAPGPAAVVQMIHLRATWSTLLTPQLWIGVLAGAAMILVAIRLRQVCYPLYGRHNPDTARLVSLENPIEMLDYYDVREGELGMYIGYGGRDQFNIDAQVESFLYRARQRGLTIAVDYDPKGKHDAPTALRLFPCTIRWLAPLIAAYAPAAVK